MEDFSRSMNLFPAPVNSGQWPRRYGQLLRPVLRGTVMLLPFQAQIHHILCCLRSVVQSPLPAVRLQQVHKLTDALHPVILTVRLNHRTAADNIVCHYDRSRTGQLQRPLQVVGLLGLSASIKIKSKGTAPRASSAARDSSAGPSITSVLSANPASLDTAASPDSGQHQSPAIPHLHSHPAQYPAPDRLAAACC